MHSVWLILIYFTGIGRCGGSEFREIKGWQILQERCKNSDRFRGWNVYRTNHFVRRCHQWEWVSYCVEWEIIRVMKLYAQYLFFVVTSIITDDGIMKIYFNLKKYDLNLKWYIKSITALRWRLWFKIFPQLF